jgi:hypothetical protein
MKKISLKNVRETLTRTEMKAINGGSGGDCKLVVANANGTYTTYNGTCNVPVTYEFDSMGHLWPVASGPAFCDTGDGVSHTITSNGGQS